jgi:DNA invertase Pin-like site-specific DNA recombinase
VKTATYLRVSTTGQDHEPQRQELAEYARRREFREVTEYSDTISGAKFTRTGLDKLMRNVLKGRIARLLVVKLDRLGRSLPQLAQLIGELDGHKVALTPPAKASTRAWTTHRAGCKCTS